MHYFCAFLANKAKKKRSTLTLQYDSRFCLIIIKVLSESRQHAAELVEGSVSPSQ